MKGWITAAVSAVLLSSCTVYENESVRLIPPPEAEVGISDDGWNTERTDSVEHGF